MARRRRPRRRTRRNPQRLRRPEVHFSDVYDTVVAPNTTHSFVMSTARASQYLYNPARVTKMILQAASDTPTLYQFALRGETNPTEETALSPVFVSGNIPKTHTVRQPRGEGYWEIASAGNNLAFIRNNGAKPLTVSANIHWHTQIDILDNNPNKTQQLPSYATEVRNLREPVESQSSD